MTQGKRYQIWFNGKLIDNITILNVTEKRVSFITDFKMENNLRSDMLSKTVFQQSIDNGKYVEITE